MDECQFRFGKTISKYQILPIFSNSRHFQADTFFYCQTHNYLHCLTLLTTITNVLTLHYIIVVIIIITFVISNALTVLQTSLAKTPPNYNTWHSLPYLQYAIKADTC